MLRSAFMRYRIKKADQSVGAYYSKILGVKNYLHFFHYLFQAILCQDPDHYPAGQLFKKRKRNSQYTKSFSLRKGLAQILDIIKVNPSMALEYENITKITKDDDLYVLWSRAGKVAAAKFICLACDPKTAALLMGESRPALAGLLQRFSVVQVQSLLIGSTNDPLYRKGKEKERLRQKWKRSRKN